MVVIHCNSGKGRAGTSCVCLLYYIQFCSSVYDCAQLFGKKRFDDNETGVSQPCQVRFIHYFEAFLNGLVKSPEIKILKKITISGYYSQSQKINLVQILKVGPLKDVEKHVEPVNGSSYDDLIVHIGWNGKGVALAGSSLVSFRKNGNFHGTKEIFRVSFHTAFIGPKNIVEADTYQVCPESLSKDNTLSKDKFKVVFEFEDYCPECCSHNTEIKDICGNCRSNEDLMEEMGNWD